MVLMTHNLHALAVVDLWYEFFIPWIEQEILQAVHDEEKHEMVRISEEKHQLGECLDIMSSELDKLQSAIANEDNPQRVLDNGAALDVMLGAIELGHNRAEQLESKIGKLQVTYDYVGTALLLH